MHTEEKEARGIWSNLCNSRNYSKPRCYTEAPPKRKSIGPTNYGDVRSFQSTDCPVDRMCSCKVLFRYNQYSGSNLQFYVEDDRGVVSTLAFDKPSSSGYSRCRPIHRPHGPSLDGKIVFECVFKWLKYNQECRKAWLMSDSLSLTCYLSRKLHHRIVLTRL